MHYIFLRNFTDDFAGQPVWISNNYIEYATNYNKSIGNFRVNYNLL